MYVFYFKKLNVFLLYTYNMYIKSLSFFFKELKHFNLHISRTEKCAVKIPTKHPIVKLFPIT